MTSPGPRTCDAIVIGAGIIGAACAYTLSRAGLSVTVVERGPVATGTSSACSGFCAVSTKKPGLMMELAKASKAMYVDLGAEWARRIELYRAGGLILIESDAEAQHVRQLVKTVQSAGEDLRLLDAQEAHALEPGLSPRVSGAAFGPNEFSVNPYLATFALLEAARERGAVVVTGEEVAALLRSGDAVAGVRTPRCTFLAPTVVIACGVWSPQVGALAGVRIPIVPRRGEVVVTEKAPLPVRIPLLSAQYLVAKANPADAETSADPLVRMGYGFLMEVLPSGQLLIGSTRTFSGYDRATTDFGVRTIVREAVKRVPAAAELNMVRGYAGLRPYVPDKLPIVGPVSAAPGLYVASGHEGDGITLAPITAALIAEQVTGQRPSFDITALTPDRFASETARNQ